MELYIDRKYVGLTRANHMHSKFNLSTIFVRRLLQSEFSKFQIAGGIFYVL